MAQERNEMADHAVLLEQLSKRYEQGSRNSHTAVHAFGPIDLSVQEGEFVCIVGPNGSGKTSLLQCISGLLEPSTGKTLVHGVSPTKAVIGFVFQNYREALLPWRTCVDNIAFPLEVQGVDKASRREQARETVRQLVIKVDLDSYPYQQSGGQQQLVAISRALIASPDVLIMDEPLSSLDFRTSLAMRSKIEDIWQRTGKTVLYVSHDVDESVYLSDRIVLLSDRPGKVIEIVQNGLPRPRSEYLDSREYLDLRSRVLSHYMK